jgi:RND family efflux transporter MFP subunit
LSANTVEVHARSASKVVSDGLIRAPFDGVIAERFVDSGQYVRADSPVVSLAQLDPIRLEFTVAEADIPQVRDGATLTFTVPAFPDRVNTGTVRFVSGAVREGTRDLVAEAMVSNPDKSLKPGMFATVSLRVTDVSMPVIPKSAVRVTEGRSYVYLVANKRIEQRVVLTDIEQGDDVAVSRGIQPHDRIVAKISDNVSNGQYVD